MEGEVTRLEHSHLIAEESTTILGHVNEPSFLEVAEGKDQGKRFTITGPETGVGRSIDNDVILTDISVSRRHLKLVQVPEGLKLVDLGSGNGSLVNGEKHRELLLKEGDRIEIGETVLVVRIPAGSAPAAPIGPAPVPASVQAMPQPMPGAPQFQPPPETLEGATPSAPSMAPMQAPPPTHHVAAPGGLQAVPRAWFVGFMVIGGLIIALLGATVTVLVLRGDSETTVAQVPIDDGSTPLYNQGVAAYHRQEYDRAVEYFTQVVQLRPNEENALRNLSAAQKAARHQRQLQEARAALEAEEWADARRRAQRIIDDDFPLDGEGSPLAPDAAAIVRTADEGRLNSLVAAGRTAVEEGDVAEARFKLTEAEGIDSDHEDVVALAALIQGSDADDGESEAAAQVVAGGERAAPRAGPRPISVRGPTPLPGRGMMAPTRRGGDALGFYRSGDFARAARAARSSGGSGRERQQGQTLASNIEQFAGLYSRVRSRQASADDIRRARNLDRSISNGHYASQINPALAEALMRTVNGSSNPTVRCPAVRQVLQVNPNHPQARTISQACEREARQRFDRARRMEQTNPSAARTMYSQVREMLPRSHPLAQDAYRRSNALFRPSRIDEDESN